MGDSKKNQGKSNPFKSTMKRLSEQFGGGDTETKIIEYELEIEKLLVQVTSMEQEMKENVRRVFMISVPWCW